MWKPGNLIQIKERLPIESGFLILSTTCRVINNSGAHRCLNCPMQQKYCDIATCEANLPLTCTLKKVHPESDSYDSRTS